MPVPPLDRIRSILPPHLGNPETDVSAMSPYPCTLEEICRRFAVTQARFEILQGLLDFRQELVKHGITGFQWICGSFVEFVEYLEQRDPKDVDVGTFIATPENETELVAIEKQQPDLFNREYVKATYKVDSLRVPLYLPPRVLVDHARYWFGLFTHRRDTIWKGVLQSELAPNIDEAARAFMENLIASTSQGVK